MSRVRKPPGGDSSFNIFGVATEPSNAKKATENNNQKAADNSVQKTTGNGIEKATELHVKTDEAVAKEEDPTSQKTEDKNEKEKVDIEVEEEKEKEEELKDGADQVSANTAAPASVDVKDSPAKSENHNTPESKKSQPKVAYNPITGQPYGSPEKRETETKSVSSTTRVRQPPGGASSKLW
jgi:hypothetical protein